MADKKISALTAATTPLAGTEVLPIVQGGSTVKVSIDNLTAGKTVSAQNIDVKLPFYDPNGNPRVMTGVSGSDPYLELDRWTGAGTNFGAMRLSYDNSIMSIATSNYGNIGSLTFTTRMQVSNAGNITANTGNFVLGTAGKGVTLKSPDGLTTKTLTIDNAGNIALI